MRTGIQGWESSTVRLLAAVGLLACAVGCRGSGVASSTEQFPEETGFVQRQIVVDGQAKSIWVFVPLDYTPHRMYPAILFLHGLFERGNGNGGTNVLSAGLGPVIARQPERWPFITIFPQSDGTWSGPEREQLALAALSHAQRHYMIDSTRVILAGLSFGGLGVWEIGANHPHRFAGLVPVSAMSALEVAPSLNSVPVWAFASGGDLIVNPGNSDEMVRAIQASGGRAKVTEFSGGKHDCWTQAVDESELVRWMLLQRSNPLAGTAAPRQAANSQRWGRLRSLNDP
jgi:predicted peptidase